MWYKGTKQECEAYNNLVSEAKGYKGTTLKWSNIIEIEGVFYIDIETNHKSGMEVVDSLPIINLID